jgi:outer membrane protein assembly factor BamB
MFAGSTSFGRLNSQSACGWMCGVATVVCACVVPFAAAVGSAAEPATTSADWPAWRGARRDGVAVGAALPRTWPTEIKPLWSVATGEGWSSPIVAEGRVFITDRTDRRERTAAYDAGDGRLLWEQVRPVAFETHAVGRRHGNGPKATPTFVDGRVYSLGIAGRLTCFHAADGREIWSHFFPAEFAEQRTLLGDDADVNEDIDVTVPTSPGRGGAVPLFGYTGSPIVDGDRLITSVGGAKGGTVMAFDKNTGAVLWKSLNENLSYSSPIVADLAGMRQVLIGTGPRMVGLDVRDGRLLWSFEYQNDHDETIGTPVTLGDLVIMTAVGRPLTAHRISRSGDACRAEEVWRNDEMTSYLSSMIVVGRHMYGMNDGGEWQCVDPADGRSIWRGGAHGYYTTPVAADGRLLSLNERGALLVLAADPAAFRQEAVLRLTTEATWTSPAVVGSRIYVRSKTQLSCFEFTR